MTLVSKVEEIQDGFLFQSSSVRIEVKRDNECYEIVRTNDEELKVDPQPTVKTPREAYHVFRKVVFEYWFGKWDLNLYSEMQAHAFMEELFKPLTKYR